jgi:hypothetical protein
MFQILKQNASMMKQWNQQEPGSYYWDNLLKKINGIVNRVMDS